MPDDKPSLPDRLGNAAFLAIMGLARVLPYERRIPQIKT